VTVTLTPQATLWHGHPCTRLANPHLELLIAEQFGPRIVSLRPRSAGSPDGDNLLAELPDFALDCPGAGKLWLRGGHRLWHAPESARRTWLPDDRPMLFNPLPDGVRVTESATDAAGLRKTLEITLAPDAPTVTIQHTLTNESLWEVRCAPWAITQFPPGSVAELPLAPASADPDGVQPDRALILWPYTNPADPRISWGAQTVRIEGDPAATGPLKIGWANPAGWLACTVGGVRFEKRAPWHPAATWTDQGASSQCYTNARFLELETLGPLTTLAPGGSVSHTEEWRISRQARQERDSTNV
jgi:hypothetical protein